MEQFFPDTGFPDAERACGTGLRHLPWPGLRHLPWPGLRHAERKFFVRQHWLLDTPAPQPVAGRRHLPKRCFGSGCARPVATLKVPEARTARRLSWLDSMLFLARQRAFPGRELPAETHGYAGDPEVAPPQGDKYHRRQRRCEPADAGETERLATPGYGSERH